MNDMAKIIDIKLQQSLSQTEIMQMLCKTSNKFGLVVSFDSDEMVKNISDGKWEYDELARATNDRVKIGDNIDIIIDGVAYFLFNTEADAYDAYNDIVGDDGPTNRNSYDGDMRVYALTISNEGELWSENT